MERRSDTEESFGDQQPPSSVSDQNNEEAQPGLDGGDTELGRVRSRDGDKDEWGAREGNAGGASEGSQSTGHPRGAG